MLSEISQCLDCIREDFKVKHYGQNIRLLRFLIYYILDAGMFATVNYRMSRLLGNVKLGVAARFLMKITERVSSVSISPSARIGPGLCIRHGLNVVIGKSAVIGDHCTIMQGTTIGGNFHKEKKDDEGNTFSQPIIGNYVHLGVGSTIIGPVRIGNHVIVGANTTVAKDISDYSIVFGDTALIQRTIDPTNVSDRERFNTIFPDAS